MKKSLFVLLFSIALFSIFNINSAVLCKGGSTDSTSTAYFDAAGNLHYDTVDKEATSGTHYYTVGWNMCKDEILGTKGIYATIPMTDQEAHKDTPKKGEVTTNFTTGYQTIIQLGEHANYNWMHNLETNGGDVWLNGCLVVLEYNSKGEKIWQSGDILLSTDGRGGAIGVTQQGAVYTSLSGIRNSAEREDGTSIKWAQPDGLETHFNIKATFMPQNSKAGIEKVIVNNYLDEGGKITPILQWNYTDSLKLNQKVQFKHKNTTGFTFAGNNNGTSNIQNLDNLTSGDVTVTNNGSTDTYYINYYYTKPEETWHESNDNIFYGEIAADDRYNNKFDVLQGIPTSEKMYVNLFTNNYIYDVKLKYVTGVKNYTVTVKRKYVSPDGKENTVLKDYAITRSYGYWEIQNFDALALHGAVVKNDALQGNSVTLTPNGYNNPNVNMSHSDSVDDHVSAPSNMPTYCKYWIGKDASGENIYKEGYLVDAGSENVDSLSNTDTLDLSSYVNNIGHLQVSNDHLTFDGTTIINNNTVDSAGDYPNDMPDGATIGDNVLYKNNLLIDSNELNGVKQTSGDIYYNRLNYSIVDGSDGWGSQLDYKLSSTDYLPSINAVTVHTPVVCDSGIYSKLSEDQRYNADTTKAALILGKPFKIQFPTTGEHLDIPGYGERDYAKYTREKQVKFPFDAYYGDDTSGTFIPKNTWHTVPLSTLNLNFYLPIWVNEDDYTVDFREVAENTPAGGGSQNIANLNIVKYIATKSLPVQVVGQLYNYRISDIKDYPTWQNVFRTGKNTTKHTSNYYYVGTKDKDGNNRGNSSKFTLTVIDGSNSKYKNIGSLKLGTKFCFDLDTIGGYYGLHDYINIKPTFYWVDKNGNNRQQVDLYYNAKINGKQQNLVGIGSQLDKKNSQYIRLGDPYRNVPAADVTNTINLLHSSHESTITKTKFLKQNTKVGSFGEFNLTAMLRTFIGDTSYVTSAMKSADVDTDKVKMSHQKWYGEYYIPNNTYVVKNGFDIIDYAKKHHGVDGKESVFLKNGYIIVNFNITAVKSSTPFLSYYQNLCDMWKIEGFDYTKKDYRSVAYTLYDGDVVFYNQKKLANSYTSGGTH